MKSKLLKKHICDRHLMFLDDFCECFIEAEAATRKKIERKVRKLIKITPWAAAREELGEELLNIIKGK